MIRNSRRMLAGLGVAFTAAAVAVSGTPAQAAESGLTSFFEDVTIAAGSPGIVQSVNVYSVDPVSTTDISIVFDTSGLANVATIAPEAEEFWDDFTCATAGTIITCTWNKEWPVEFNEGGLSVLDVVITPVDGAAVDASGSLSTTVTAVGASHTTTSKITIGEGVNLAATSQEITGSATPNSTVAAASGVRNVGEKTAEGVVLWVSGTPGMGLAQYGNCQYMTQNGYRQTYCEFDDELAPGSTHQVEFDLQLSGQVFAPGRQYGFFEWMTPAAFADRAAWQKFAGVTFTPGTGAPLELTEASSATRRAQVDIDPADNGGMIEIAVTGTNAADLEALGVEFDGEAGTSATVQVGVKNHGPALLDGSMGGFSATAIRVEVPAGTTVTEVDEACNNDTNASDGWVGPTPGGTVYHCYTDTQLLPGEQEVFDFTFRIDQKKTNAVGSVTANPKAWLDGRSGDTNAKNDVAYILVNGDGTLPPPGGEGGQGGGGGTLPITGAKAGLIGAAGAVLLAAGVAGFLLARRRRTTFVA